MGKMHIWTQFATRIFLKLTSISLTKLMTHLKMLPRIEEMLDAQTDRILQTRRYRHQMMLFWRTQTAIREQTPILHELPTMQQQYANVTKVKLALSVQSRKLKKNMVGVRARLRDRVMLLMLWSLNSQIFMAKTRNRLPKTKLLSARTEPKLLPVRKLHNFCRQQSPGGVVILLSHTPNQLLQQCRNCRQWKYSSMQTSGTYLLKRTMRMMLGMLMKRRSFSIEFLCSRIMDFFSLKPKNDSTNFIRNFAYSLVQV